MLTNGSRQAGQCWQGREDRGLCRSLALLNLMLTDSNEDSLLARIERRGVQRRGGHGPPLYLSRPLIKASVHTHTHTHVPREIQTQAHTSSTCTRQTRADTSQIHRCYTCVLGLINLIKRIRNKVNCDYWKNILEHLETFCSLPGKQPLSTQKGTMHFLKYAW